MFSYWTDARGLQAGIWNRVSDERQVRDESPEVHLSRNVEFCAGLGMPVVAVYELPGVSGASVLTHPEGKRMWRDVAAGRIKVLVFSSLARVGRDLLELLQIEKHLTKHGCRLISIRERIDTSTPDGMDYFVMLANRAQTERLELSARVRAGLKQRARMGQITGRAPYGFHKVNRQLVESEKEGFILKLMFELYLQDRRQMAVAAELNRRGYRNRAGEAWDHQQVKRALTNSAGMGLYWANRTGVGNVVKPETEWIPIEVPQLIDPEKWRRVQALLASKVKPARRVVYPYSGLLRCHCEAKMYVRANFNHQRQAERRPPRYECRSCGNHVRLTVLDNAIGDLFKGFMLDDVDEAELELSQAERQMQTLQAQLKDVKASKKRWATAYGAGAIDLAEFTAQHAPLVEQERALSAEVARIEAEQATTDEQLEAHQEAAQALQTAAWSELEADAKARIMREFVQGMVLTATEIQLHMLFSPALLQLAEQAEAIPVPGFRRLHIRTIRRPDVVDEPSDRRAWGYHLRKVRKERGESAKAVARRLKIGENQLTRWELLSYPPGAAQLPGIIKYIGFVPWSRTPYAQPTLGDAVRTTRELLGLNQVQLSKLTGVSQGMISLVELNQGGMSEAAWEKLEQGLGMELRRIYSPWHPA